MPGVYADLRGSVLAPAPARATPTPRRATHGQRLSVARRVWLRGRVQAPAR